MVDRDLDLLVAQKVLKLQDAGWYKRVSSRSGGHVKATGPEDFTEDEPRWKADRYFICQGHLAEDGQVVGDIFAVPYCSTKWDDAMRVRTHLVREGLGRQLEAEVIKLAGTWLMATPRDLCHAALAVVDAPRPHAEGDWNESEARTRAFAEDGDRDLEMALVKLDETRETMTYNEDTLRCRSEELQDIDEAIHAALPHWLVYDRRHQRIRALARERDTAVGVLRDIYATLAPYRHTEGYQTNVMAMGVGNSLRAIEQSKLPGFKEPENP